MMNRHEALEKLVSSKEYEQVLALAALGRVGTVDDLHNIIPLITKSNFEIRHIAAGVASSIIRINLLDRYEEQSEATRDKLGALLSKLTPDLVQEIGRDILREDGLRRKNAIRLLRHLKFTPSVKQMVTELLTSNEQNIKEVALEVINSFKGGVNHDILLEWIYARDERLRANAVEIIEYLGDSSLIDLLYQLKNDPNNRVRANVLKAIHTLTEVNIDEDLIKMLESSEIKMISSALWIIGNMESVENMTLCNWAKKLLRHPDLNVVNNAVKALRNMPFSAAKMALMQAGYPIQGETIL